MSGSEWVALSVAAVLTENFVLVEFLGIGGVLRQFQGFRAALVSGFVVTAMMVLSAPILWAVDHFLLRSFGLEYLRILSYLLILALLEELLRGIVRRIPGRKAPPLLLPLSAVNAAVLGGALLVAQEGLALPLTMASALVSGAGFTFAAVLIASVRGRLAFSRCPKAFRGMPITFITAGLLAMVLWGFMGVRI